MLYFFVYCWKLLPLTAHPMNENQRLFLLGGHDLEMETVREMLQSRGEVYCDRGLIWSNATLSSYSMEMETFWRQYPDGIIYGVELTDDVCAVSGRYYGIDHHNALSGNPSALEQVMVLLGIRMTRRYELVAANDRRYIPGMLEIGATDEEIRIIRREDRRCQGVTENDEHLAEKSIAENLLVFGNLSVVRSLGPRFSPICDRLFPYHSLLIYTDAEWMYYGHGARDIRDKYSDAVSLGKVFYGGGDDGYVGSVAYAYSQIEIENLVDDMVYGCTQL